MKRFYFHSILVLLASILFMSCDNESKNYPKDYVGFKNSSQTYTYDKSNEEETLIIKIIALKKEDKDRKIKISVNKTPVVAGAFKLVDDYLTIKAGSKEALLKIKIYPNKITKGTFIQLSSMGQWQNGQSSRLTIKLTPKK